jgi:FAD/FMN-containing dehydrogenase
MERRVLLKAAGIGIAAAGVSGSASAKVPTGADWRALDAGLSGTVEVPGSRGYDAARKVVDPRFDTARPPAVARCRVPQDVAQVVAFARRYGLPVVPRGGGHSYVGVSAGSGGIVVDTRAMSAVRYDAGTGTAVIGGGARLLDVYEALGAQGRGIPAGACGTVGIGGLTLGGGIGLASSMYGLTSDAVLAANLVTADGRHRTVDAQREPDLFWALRGGGGGHLGVVTAWRMRTFGTGRVGQFTLTFPWADAGQVAAGWQARLAVGPDSSWSTLQFTADARGRRGVKINGFTLGGDANAEADAMVAAIRREPASVALELKEWLPVMRARAGSSARATELVGSDVFVRPVPADVISRVLAVVGRRAAARKPGVAKFKPLTGAVGRVAPEATAFPWRRAFSMVQWLVQPPVGDAATVRDAYAFIAAGHQAVAGRSAGRYVNYLEPGTADLALYHGAHLDRLRRIRTGADPNGVFRSRYAV